MFQIGLLFAADTLYVWDAEKKFVQLKLEHSRLAHHDRVERRDMTIIGDIKEKGDVTTVEDSKDSNSNNSV
jgi:hypothetical protein